MSLLHPKVLQARRARSRSLVMGENRVPSPGQSPTFGQEQAVKSGWLKKQRSIMKNWQQRWFVLRGQELCYYKDEEETKPQGCIPLPGNRVVEITPQPEEPNRHLFEIVPDHIPGLILVPTGRRKFGSKNATTAFWFGPFRGRTQEGYRQIQALNSLCLQNPYYW
ncbi:rho GTPase-activating protein 22-like [Pelobates fuscus]|uniref:rho GTPase-activating protein 22-like n=1 Tax=Pelobates fuscus TaxID=191477 RepID=UPI002FE4F26F